MTKQTQTAVEQPELAPTQTGVAVREPPQDAGTPMTLLQQAVASGRGVEELKELMALQERWEANKARRAFVEAMAEFQSRLPCIPKTREVHRTGGGLLYRFANADDITRAIRAVEKECGFSHRFEFEPNEGGGCRTKCIITHKDGHSESTTVTIPPTKGMNTNAAQDSGIAMQYGMRYALTAAYGITTANEDTDGAPATAEPLIDEHFANLTELFEESGADKAQFLKWANVKTLAAFPESKYAEACALLQRKIKERKP